MVIALFAILVLHEWWAASKQIEVIPYSTFEELLKAGQIEEITVRQNHLSAASGINPMGLNQIP